MTTIRLGQRRHSGFTIVEIIIVIVIIGILAALGTVAYNGLQKRAAGNAVLSDLENASAIVEQYAAKNNGNFPDNTYLQANLNKSSGVNISIVLSDSSGGQAYSGLTPAQNGVLFYNVCTNLVNQNRPDVPALKYGQGYQRDRNTGGNLAVYNYLWGPNTCNVYNNDNIEMNGAWASAGTRMYVPINQQRVLQEATKNRTDQNPLDFPDYNTVVNQFYQTLNDQFLAQGGTYPITIFWDPWCPVGASYCNTQKPELPILPGGGSPGGSTNQPNELTKSYCVAGTSTKYSDIIYSFSSNDLKSKQGNCS